MSGEAGTKHHHHTHLYTPPHTIITTSRPSCCQLSNHTGYPVIKGHVFDGSHLNDLLEGLRANGLICHTHLLTGVLLCCVVLGVYLCCFRGVESGCEMAA